MRYLQLAFLTLLTLTLFACGGGGSSSSNNNDEVNITGLYKGSLTEDGTTNPNDLHGVFYGGNLYFVLGNDALYTGSYTSNDNNHALEFSGGRDGGRFVDVNATLSLSDNNLSGNFSANYTDGRTTDGTINLTKQSSRAINNLTHTVRVNSVQSTINITLGSTIRVEDSTGCNGNGDIARDDSLGFIAYSLSITFTGCTRAASNGIYRGYLYQLSDGTLVTIGEKSGGFRWSVTTP